MSEMERNKGILKYVPIDTEDFTEEDFDTYREAGFLVIDDEVWEVKYEVERDSDCCGFTDIKVNSDGTYYFHTYHYNGGGSLEEVLSTGLSKLTY
jgi:hypothetical protein